jgi:hypothetical protein
MITIAAAQDVERIEIKNSNIQENDGILPKQQQPKEDERGLWGSKTTTTTTSQQSQQDETDNNTNDNSYQKPFGMATGPGGQQTYTRLYEPPQGFRITSRVYTDSNDKLAHFDNESPMVFPYWECGVSGSTTVPIPLRHATVRHLLGGSQPNTYSGEEFGPHPQLVVALTHLEVVLNSGQVQTFKPGDVLLLEDVLSGGHKLKGHDKQDMTVMILTLPQHYHQVGKDKSSLDAIMKKESKNGPCKTGLELKLHQNKIGDAIRSLRPTLSPRTIRRTILTSIGLTLSTVAGDFMGKVAPLWLAVLFGGGCFVTGGTVAFVKLGEYSLNELEMRQERRQLQIENDDLFKETTASVESEDNFPPATTVAA